MRTKSQVAAEFLFYVGFLFILSLVFISVAAERMSEYYDKEKVDMVNNFGESIQKEIEIASVVSPGYVREITLPEKIRGIINYSIVLESSTLIISTEYYDYSAIVPSIKGNISKGNNLIKNIDNRVVIENV